MGNQHTPLQGLGRDQIINTGTLIYSLLFDCKSEYTIMKLYRFDEVSSGLLVVLILSMFILHPLNAFISHGILSGASATVLL